MTGHRAGFVAILGRPNAGKSTLLNAILGEKLAIVTHKPQTTRSRILGIHTRPDAQLLFVDTPGLHRSERAFNVALDELAREAGDESDVALLLAAPDQPWDEDYQALWERLERRGVACVAALTKVDLPAAADVAWPPPGLSQGFRVSARTGEGLDALVDALVQRLPESPPLYLEDELSDRPLRFLVAELVREAAFEALEQELPYQLAVEVESFDESREDLVRIAADLIVERASQKPIAIGRGGSRIKQIGIAARREIEQLLGRRVHLALRVKVEPHWTRKPARLRSLGYS